MPKNGKVGKSRHLISWPCAEVVVNESQNLGSNKLKGLQMKNGNGLSATLDRPTKRAKKDKVNVTELSVSRLQVEELQKMMPVAQMGRFQDVKLHIKREIGITKQGHFFTVKAAGQLATDEKERNAFISAINGMLGKSGGAWIIRYSKVINAFIVCRKEDWIKAKKSKAGL